jgi:hypothetical protein
MAKEEQILLENIFNTACVIEESMWDTVKNKAKSGMQSIGNKIKSKVHNAYNDFMTNATLDTIRVHHKQSKKAEAKLEELAKQEKKLKKEKDRTQGMLNWSNALKNSLIDDLQRRSKGTSERSNAGEKPIGDRPKTTNSNIGAGNGAALLGLGLGTGAIAQSLSDKAPDIADETGEHINSLRDKLANIIAVHHEE